MAASRNESELTSQQPAFLIYRDGDAWGEIVRLIPGQVSTIGRAPTNRVVVRDEICSRNHCEVFSSGGQWMLRDLGSRNGTRVNGDVVLGDWTLKNGQLIQIGNTELWFTLHLSHSGQDDVPRERLEHDTATDQTVSIEVDRAAGPSILHRTSRSRYEARDTDTDADRDRFSRDLSRLYRLALKMGTASDSKQLSEIVLDGLFEVTAADIGAVLLLPKATATEVRSDQLSVLAYKSIREVPYQRVSDFLSNLVLKNREAVLAHDIESDSRLANRDSLGEISACSVICAPIRVGTEVHGLLHLYSTDPDNALERDDLEFALAVADQFAIGLENLTKREQLAAGLARAETENRTLREQLGLDTTMIGDSPSMQQLKERIARIAPSDATVLILGESGVGKELVARAIHFNSGRRNQPFVCMNCAALSESLLESELFGHEKGAFTGATGRKIGKFEQAHEGTLFLDEVGEMGPSIQAKFLRVLEGHPFERVGGGVPVNVDVRVVAATNRELEKSVEEGAFRKDLYFRLHVVEIRVDALRQRPTDVSLLAQFFLDRCNRKSGRQVHGFSPAALDKLENYDWPGNVRELQNTVERAVILCNSEQVEASDIQLSSLGAPDSPSDGSDRGASEFRPIPLVVLEQEHILATLESTGWNKSQAAQILGIERSTLDRKLKRYDVGRPAG